MTPASTLRKTECYSRLLLPSFIDDYLEMRSRPSETQIMSATVHFDKMQYEDAVKFLAYSKKYDTELRLRQRTMDSSASPETAPEPRWRSATLSAGGQLSKSPILSPEPEPHNILLYNRSYKLV